MRRRLALAGAALAGAASARTSLGEDLQRWLRTHPQLRFAPERDYGPFVYAAADGRIAGLSVDLLRLVAQQVGLAYQTLPAQPLSAILAALRRRDADLASSLRPTPERAEFVRFTRPYLQVPAVLAVRASQAGRRLAGLAGYAVAVGQGYAVESHVRTRFPNVRWTPVPSDVEGLEGLAAGRFEAAVADLASLAFVTRERALDGIVVAQEVGFEYGLCFAVRRDWPELVDILEQGMHGVGLQERNAAIARTLGPYADALIQPRAAAPLWIGAGLAGAGALLAGYGLWRRAGRRGEPG